MWVRHRPYIPPADHVRRQVSEDLADAAFAELIRQKRGEQEYQESAVLLAEFAPLETLLSEQSIDRADARRTYRLYARAYTAYLYRSLHARALAPMEFWCELLGIGRTWLRLQLAALAHAVGAGVRMRIVQVASKPAHPSE